MPSYKKDWWKRAFKNITKEPIKKYPNFTLYQIYGIKKDR